MQFHKFKDHITPNFKSYNFQREKAFQIWFQIISEDELWLQRMGNQAYCNCLKIRIKGLWERVSVVTPISVPLKLGPFCSCPALLDILVQWDQDIPEFCTGTLSLHYFMAVRLVYVSFYHFTENKVHPICKDKIPKWYLHNPQQNWDYNHLENVKKSAMLTVISQTCLLE